MLVLKNDDAKRVAEKFRNALSFATWYQERGDGVEIGFASDVRPSWVWISDGVVKISNPRHKVVRSVLARALPKERWEQLRQMLWQLAVAVNRRKRR